MLYISFCDTFSNTYNMFCMMEKLSMSFKHYKTIWKNNKPISYWILYTKLSFKQLLQWLKDNELKVEQLSEIESP